MRRLITVSIIIFVILWTVPAVAADELQIEAEGAVVIDGETGRVLWAKNPHLPLPPASTTKIMTSLLGLELGRPEEVVTVSQLAASQDGSRVYLGAGEEYTLRELLYAVQLASANDAAVAVAEHLAGSVEGFARLMNQRARELGAKNTNFINPNGLPDPEHRTSAYDLALIARKALEYPEYREMITTKCYPMSWPGHWEERQLWNRNKLLEIYEGADGVKTGYTIEAGHTFVGSATREGRQLISVVLGSTNDGVWSGTVKLLDYGFENYSNHELVMAGEEITVVPVKYGTEVPVQTAAGFIYTLAPGEQERISTEVNLPEILVAPLEAGAQLGTLTVSLGTEKLAEIPLVAAREVRRKLYTRWWFWPVAVYIPWRIRVGIRRLQRHRQRQR
jgi:D-alanyl-D-alanine carboxypeptidase (penicillin-binding protein 5/6)